MALALALLSVAGLSCSDPLLDPYANDGRYFTVFGYLDVFAAEQAVRVVPVTRLDPVVASATSPGSTIDAQVYITDTQTGSRVRLRHALERLTDGTYGHVFRASLRPVAGRTYLLEVVRSDGKTARAHTTVPHIAEADRIERSPERVEQGMFVQDVFMPGVRSPWHVEAVYNWDWKGEHRSFRTYVPYGRPGERSADGWRLRIRISEDQHVVQEHMDEVLASGVLPEDAPLRLRTIGLRLRLLDDAWDPPGGVFDPEALARPGAMSNIEGGWGFFGSIGNYVQEWDMIHLSTALGYD